MTREEASGYRPNLHIWRVVLGMLLPAWHSDSALPRGAVPHAIVAPTNLLSHLLPGLSPTPHPHESPGLLCSPMGLFTQGPSSGFHFDILTLF